MKALGIILKIFAALAAIAGVIYVVATYGDKIVAWARMLLDRVRNCCCSCNCGCCETDDVVAEDTAQAEEADFEA